MRARFALKMLVSAAALAAAVPAAAAPIIDQSPNAIAPFANNFNGSNTSSTQNFYVQVVLTQSVQVTGFSIFSSYFSTPAVGTGLGTSVIFRLRDDAAGRPDTSLLRSITTTLSAVDNIGSSDPRLNRLHADFTPFTLRPGTYWAGLSGNGFEQIGWNIDFSHAGPNTPACQFNGNSLDFCFSPSAALAFTLDGAATGTVPEPASWAMLILGIGAVGGALRRRTRVALPA